MKMIAKMLALALFASCPLITAQFAAANSDAPKSGTLAVVNKSDNSVSFIDVASKTIITTLPTGQGPHELVLSPNGRWAVSTNFVGGNSLTVFNVQEQTVARTIALPTLPGPHGIRFLQDSTHVIFTSGKGQAVGIVNIESAALIKRIETGQNTTHMLTLNGDESEAYSTNIRSDSISVLSLSAGKKIKDIATQQMPEAINFSVAANELWYGANQAGKVVVMNPRTEEVLAVWDDFGFPYRVVFNHDESIAVVPDFTRHNVRFFNTLNKQEIGKLTLNEDTGPQGIVLHPTKDIVFLSLNLQNMIIAIDIATQSIIGQYPTGNNPDGVIFIKQTVPIHPLQ